MSRVARTPRVYLQTMSKHGRPCESCGCHVHDHEWIDIDTHGFAVHCDHVEDKKCEPL